MQVQGLSGNQTTLSFNDVVPSQTSSRRVAAAAFHHCLGMSRVISTFEVTGGCIKSEGVGRLVNVLPTFSFLFKFSQQKTSLLSIKAEPMGN